MGMNKDAALVLLTEEVLILFKLVHNVRKTGQAFSMATNPKDFMLQCLWVTLGCHAAMEEGVKNGISMNGAINSAFVGFLTEAITKVAGMIDLIRTFFQLPLGVLSSISTIRSPVLTVSFW